MTFRNRENVFVFHASKWIAIVIRPSLNTNLSFQLENASKSDKKTISNSPGKSSNRIPHLELFGNIRDLRMFKIQSILAHKLLLVNETNNGETKQVIFYFQIFEMAAMPFPRNGILHIQGNLPRVSLYSLRIMLVVLSPISIQP